MAPDRGAPNRFARLWRRAADRRGNVALLAGALLPPLLGAIGLGVEVSYWGVVQVEMQRTADAAALGAAIVYKGSTNTQLSDTAAADIAELNGMAGSPNREWTTTTTLVDNNLTAAKVAGIQNTSDVAFKVTIQQSVPTVLTRMFMRAANVTIPVTSVAEIFTQTPGCVVALGTSSTAFSISATVLH